MKHTQMSIMFSVKSFNVSELWTYSSCVSALPDGVEADIITTIKKTFNFSQSDALHLFQTLMECMKSKELVHTNTHMHHVCVRDTQQHLTSHTYNFCVHVLQITVFHVGSEDQDIDVAILKSLLKGLCVCFSNVYFNH